MLVVICDDHFAVAGKVIMVTLTNNCSCAPPHIVPKLLVGVFVAGELLIDALHHLNHRLATTAEEQVFSIVLHGE